MSKSVCDFPVGTMVKVSVCPSSAADTRVSGLASGRSGIVIAPDHRAYNSWALGSVLVDIPGITAQYIGPKHLTAQVHSLDEWKAVFAPILYKRAKAEGMCHDGIVAFMAEHGLDTFLPVERTVEVTYRVRVSDLLASATEGEVFLEAGNSILRGDVTMSGARIV